MVRLAALRGGGSSLALAYNFPSPTPLKENTYEVGVFVEPLAQRHKKDGALHRSRHGHFNGRNRETSQNKTTGAPGSGCTISFRSRCMPHTTIPRCADGDALPLLATHISCRGIIPGENLLKN